MNLNFRSNTFFSYYVIILCRAAACAYDVKLPTVLPYWGCLDNKQKYLCNNDTVDSYNVRMPCHWSEFAVALETVKTVPKILPTPEEASY